jgi:hypothetical protein
VEANADIDRLRGSHSKIGSQWRFTQTPPTLDVLLQIYKRLSFGFRLIDGRLPRQQPLAKLPI